jgi:transposase
MPWRDCPPEYGPWHTIYTRFKRWSENGLFWKILTTLKEKKRLEFRIIFMDSTTVSTDPELPKKRGSQNIGKNVAGKGSKIHIIMGKEDAICVDIIGAQVHDSKKVEEMMNFLNLSEIDRFVADKAYDTNKIRDFLKKNNIYAEIPNKRNRKTPFRFDKTIYKWRYRIENLFQKLKENRRLCMQFDKLDCTFMAFFAIALIKLKVC